MVFPLAKPFYWSIEVVSCRTSSKIVWRNWVNWSGRRPRYNSYKVLLKTLLSLLRNWSLRVAFQQKGYIFCRKYRFTKMFIWKPNFLSKTVLMRLVLGQSWCAMTDLKGWTSQLPLKSVVLEDSLEINWCFIGSFLYNRDSVLTHFLHVSVAEFKTYESKHCMSNSC